MTQRRRNKIRSQSLLVGSFLILIGISLIFIDWYKDYRKQINDNKAVDLFFEEDVISTDIVDTQKEENKTNEEKIIENYIAVLEIPKISFKRGLYAIDSDKNNVNYNVEILQNSDMPDVENGNFVLAGHSGSGYTAFFNKLDKLVVGDESYVYYNKEKYKYKITKIYEIEKTGTATITRNKDKNVLTMVTCSQTKDDKQIVIISELVDKESY